MRNLDRKYARETFAHVVAFRVNLCFLGEFVLGDVVLQHARHRGAQAGDVRATVALRDVVRVGGQHFVVAVLPLHGDFDFDRNAVDIHCFACVEDLRVQNRTALVFEFNVRDEPFVGLKMRLVGRTQVLDVDRHARIEKRELAQTREQRVVIELRHLLENLQIG